jgi:hypothetical protein
MHATGIQRHHHIKCAVGSVAPAFFVYCAGIGEFPLRFTIPYLVSTGTGTVPVLQLMIKDSGLLTGTFRTSRNFIILFYQSTGTCTGTSSVLIEVRNIHSIVSNIFFVWISLGNKRRKTRSGRGLVQVLYSSDMKKCW